MPPPFVRFAILLLAKYLARMVNAEPSAEVLIGTLFIDLNYRGGGEPVLVAEKLAGEVRPPHLEVPGLDATADPPYPC